MADACTIKCRCAFIISTSDDKTFVLADFINVETKKRFKARGKNTIPIYCSPELVANVTGVWGEYRGKDGKAVSVFDVQKFEPLLYESAESFVGYLQTCFKGVGPKTAKKLLAALNGDYTQFAQKVTDLPFLQKAIGKKLAQSLYEQYRDKEQEDELYKLLSAAGISAKKINEYRNDYQENAMTHLLRNPFVLYSAYGVSFTAADTVCMMLLPQNPELLASYERISACAHYILKSKFAFQGHTYINTKILLSEVFKKLNDKKIPELCVSRACVSAALNRMSSVGEVVCGNISFGSSKGNTCVVYDSFYNNAEAFVANRIAKMVAARPKQRTSEEINAVIAECEKEAGIQLEKAQRDAVKMVINNRFSVITGGAGTGKTTVLKFCIEAQKRIYNKQCQIALAAPTGRAAMRMAAATGITGASTIHSLLGITEDNNDLVTPQQIMSDILFVDEASMIDLGLFYKLLFNTSDSTSIVLIGDPNQLPPIGAGEVLKSVIESEIVPVTRLNIIHRQAEESKIVYNANKILCGQTDLKTGKDFIFYPYTNSEDILKTILYTFREELKRTGDICEVQVISPLREKGVLSAVSINAAVQQMVNPEVFKKNAHGEIKKPLSLSAPSGLKIRKGDKVICQKNTKRAKNGDIGIITDMYISDGSRKIEIRAKFENREEEVFSADEFREMNVSLGYAITVHKSQGSEFKVTILPVAAENKSMLRRNLFYTAVTRAKERFILVGDKNEIVYSVKNNAQERRNSCLSGRIVREAKNALRGIKAKADAEKNVQYRTVQTNLYQSLLAKVSGL